MRADGAKMLGAIHRAMGEIVALDFPLELSRFSRMRNAPPHLLAVLTCHYGVMDVLQPVVQPTASSSDQADQGCSGQLTHRWMHGHSPAAADAGWSAMYGWGNSYILYLSIVSGFRGRHYARVLPSPLYAVCAAAPLRRLKPAQLMRRVASNYEVSLECEGREG